MTSDVATDKPRRSTFRETEPAPGAERERPRPSGRVREAYAGVRARLVPPFTDNTPYQGGGWLPAILITFVAGFLRFWNLGSPDAVIFDETYYAKDAWSLLQQGYEGEWPESANTDIVSGHTEGLLSTSGTYIVHPPIGKWTIALGEWMFGLTPFGWRFAVAVLGTLSVLIMCRIGRRLFRSTLLGCVAGLLLALDGLHFVMSRTALLDLVLMFWVLAAFGCLLIDRDDTRALVARLLKNGVDPHTATTMRLGLRPWRVTAGICLGLAVGTKWSGMYVIAAFGLLTFFWDLGTRRAAGAAGWRRFTAVLRRDVPWALLVIVVVPAVIYVWSWSGWLLTDGGYMRQWAADRAGRSPAQIDTPFFTIGLPQFDMTWMPDAFRSLWHYHAEMWRFHVNLESDHPYQSNPWSWLVLGRPVSYYYETVGRGEAGCDADECAQEVLGIGTPLLWWAAAAAVPFLVYRWAARRDWRAGAVLCGLAAGWLPWFEYQNRTIFLFYAVVFVPFLVLGLTMALGALLGPPDASDRRRGWGVAAVVAVVALIAWNFLYMYPIFTGGTIPMSDWQDRMWFNTWI